MRMFAAVCFLLLIPFATKGQDLSNYRGFSFGMTREAVAAKTGLSAIDLRTNRTVPTLLQSMEWQATGRAPLFGESVSQVVFQFFDAKLYRMEITYDRQRTEGMLDQDMVDALSVSFGKSTNPDAEVMFSSLYRESVKVVARWETESAVFSLVKSTYRPVFGIVAADKQMETKAIEAESEAIRLSMVGAEQKAADLKRSQDADTQQALDKARVVNRGRFKP